MKASIIILSYNQLEKTTKPCIESIYKYTDVNDFELIIVDNNSEDETRSYLSKLYKSNKYSNLKIVLNDINKGFSAGNNDGIKISKGDYCILLNSDTLVSPNWLSSLLAHFKDNKVGLVGPVSNSVGNEQMVQIPELNEKNYVEKAESYLKSRTGKHFETTRLGFFCVAISKKVIDKVGLLDEQFGRGMFEDDDFCIRALNSGYKLLIAEDSFVYHKGSVAFSRLDTGEYQDLFNKNKKLLENKYSTKYNFDHLVESYIKKLNNDIDIEKNASLAALRFEGFRKLVNFVVDDYRKQTEKTATISSTLDINPLLNKFDELNIILSSNHKDLIIYPPTIDWNLPLLQRPQHIARSLAKLGYLFFYGSSNTYDNVHGFQEIEPNIYLTDQFSQIIEKLNSGWILFHAAHPSYSLSDLKYWKSKGFKIIYEYLDEIDEKLIKDPEILKRVLERHSQINDEIVDIAIVTSMKLVEELAKKISKEKITYSPNAVDFDHFNIQPNIENIPQELKTIVDQGKPIIGYYGALASWLDYDLLNSVIAANPQYNFVFMGWDFDNSFSSGLRKYSNSYNLGIIKYDVLPKYSIWYDVAIIPFKEGEIAKATSPLKLFEYMSSGKQVICTKDLRECYGYEGVYISQSADDFSEKLRFALRHKNNKKIIAALQNQAKNNTWYQRAEDISKAMISIGLNQRTQTTFSSFNLKDAVSLRQQIINENQILRNRLVEVQQAYFKITNSKAFKAWQFLNKFKKGIKPFYRFIRDNLIKKKINFPRTSDSIDIINLSVIGWDSRIQRPQHLATELAKKGNLIFYVQNGFMAAESADSKKLIDISAHAENIYLTTFSATRNVSIYNEIPSEKDLEIIKASLNELIRTAKIKKPVFLIDHPFWYNLVKDLNIPIIYDCMDEHSGFDNTAKIIEEWERNLMMISDITITTSNSLALKAKKLAPRVEIIKNAGEYSYFSQAAKSGYIPDDLKAIPQPIVGYYGAIAEWFDAKLLEKLAQKLPEVSFVLIGNVTNDDIKKFASKYKNIYLLGEKPYSTLVEYLRHFKVCTIPFIINDLIKATNPVKIYEYLASGKPVVTTAIPELADFKQEIYFSNNHENFIKNTLRALNEKPSKTLKAKRVSIAKKNTWERNAEQLGKYIREIN